MTAKENALALGAFWRSSAERQMLLGHHISAARRFEHAAKYYEKAGEKDLAALCLRNAGRNVPTSPVVAARAGRRPMKRTIAKPTGRKRGRPGNGGAMMARIFEFICTQKADHDGVPPSVREIMAEMGLHSSSLVAFYLSKLRGKGLIDFNPKESRTIRVTGGQWIRPPRGDKFVEAG